MYRKRVVFVLGVWSSVDKNRDLPSPRCDSYITIKMASKTFR